MKNWYKVTQLLMIGMFAVMRVQGQTHFGQGAGTSGSKHTFFGAEAGAVNTAIANTFVGAQSGKGNTSGAYNCFYGTSSGLANTTASYNVFMGAGSGASAISGGYNSFYGSMSGIDNTVGTKNSYFGYYAGKSNLNGNENAFFGSESGYNTKSGKNVFVGANAGYSTAVGGKNAFLGYNAGYNNTSGEQNTYLGYQSGGNATLTNATALGANALVTASNSIALGNGANVGIGYSAPAFQLHLSTANAAKAGSPDWIVASDSRLKKNITDFKDGLDLLKQIKPVWFQYNGQAGIETGDKKFVGIIAQEMQKIAPYTIGTFTHQDSLGNKTEYLDYDANAVTYILINSVKEQQQVIEEKEARIAALEKSQQALVARLEALELNRPSSTSGFQKTDRGVEVPLLEQNTPNGFSNKTSIKYFIPQSVKTAVIDIYTVAGIKVSSHPISGRGTGELIISADKYRSGVHVYDLIMDGKSLGAKKMVVE